MGGRYVSAQATELWQAVCSLPPPHTRQEHARPNLAFCDNFACRLRSLSVFRPTREIRSRCGFAEAEDRPRGARRRAGRHREGGGGGGVMVVGEGREREAFRSLGRNQDAKDAVRSARAAVLRQNQKASGNSTLSADHPSCSSTPGRHRGPSFTGLDRFVCSFNLWPAGCQALFRNTLRGRHRTDNSYRMAQWPVTVLPARYSSRERRSSRRPYSQPIRAFLSPVASPSSTLPRYSNQTPTTTVDPDGDERPTAVHQSFRYPHARDISHGCHQFTSTAAHIRINGHKHLQARRRWQHRNHWTTQGAHNCRLFRVSRWYGGANRCW